MMPMMLEGTFSETWFFLSIFEDLNSLARREAGGHPAETGAKARSAVCYLAGLLTSQMRPSATHHMCFLVLYP